MTTVLWFRRDLRLADHAALEAAHVGGGEVVPLFVLDPRLQATSGAPRLAFLHRCLAELHERTGGALVIRSGEPTEEVARLAREVEASKVVATEDFGPYGRRRDGAVEAALSAGGCQLDRVDSPFMAAPGAIRKTDGTPFAVYSPYYRAWKGRWPRPPVSTPELRFVTGVASEAAPAPPDLGATTILPPGEIAALERLDSFIDATLSGYAEGRNVPSGDHTSRLSAYLKYGCVHPRTVLARVAHLDDGDPNGGDPDGGDAERFRMEMAWRDFYADVLFTHPNTVRDELRSDMSRLVTDHGPEADGRFEAWAQGRTGYPIVDAGMRQLQAEAYVHNRVRMVVASFLVKDLHLPWQRGAKLFMQDLQDGDLGSNYHGWQWVAGTGTDPAPFFRIFNPTKQGQKFDPDGDYIRRFVPELADVAAPAIHEPWRLRGGPPEGYPAPIVDHDMERKDALARFAALKG